MEPMKQLNVPAEMHKIMMNFRNTIQLERDRLYKTRITDVTEVAQAHLKASEALLSLLEQVGKEIIGEDEERKTNIPDDLTVLDWQANNKLKAAQRERLDTLLKGGEL